MRRFIWAQLLAVLLAGTLPAVAQQDVQTTNQAQNDDNGEWGWLGLLGFFGLLGLRRRDRGEHVTRTHASSAR